VLYMKGTPAAPRCGFSASIVSLLREAGVAFASVDVLEDAQARAGIKLLYDFPTVPQLIVRGELIGGLDILRAMVEETGVAGLAAELGLTPLESLEARLARLTSCARVVLFMKGSPEAPRCGFSAEALRTMEAAGLDLATAAVLTGEDGKPLFATVDILADEEVREGLKERSQWPTYPQWCVAQGGGEREWEWPGGRTEWVATLHDLPPPPSSSPPAALWRELSLAAWT